jgi:hypothetical protein
VAAPLVHAIGPAVSLEDAALVEPASVVYRALAGSAVTPGSGAARRVRGADRAAAAR